MTDAILFILVATLPAMKPEAAATAAQAYYKQSGTEKYLTEYIENRTSRELRATAGSLTFVARSLVEQRVSFEWRF